VEEIFDYVFWEIRRSGFERKLIAGMVLTGGGSLLRHINLLAEYHTGLTTRMGEPIEHLAHGYDGSIASPIYSTAVGLLMYSIDNKEMKEQAEAESNAAADKAVFNIQADEHGEETSDADSEELVEAEDGGKWLKKVFTYTKEFFEAQPDSEF